MCKYCANLFSGASCEFVLSADVSVNDVYLSYVPEIPRVERCTEQNRFVC